MYEMLNREGDKQQLFPRLCNILRLQTLIARII